MFNQLSPTTAPRWSSGSLAHRLETLRRLVMGAWTVKIDIWPKTSTMASSQISTWGGSRPAWFHDKWIILCLLWTLETAISRYSSLSFHCPSLGLQWRCRKLTSKPSREIYAMQPLLDQAILLPHRQKDQDIKRVSQQRTGSIRRDVNHQWLDEFLWKWA